MDLQPPTHIPLVVDLDGTLTLVDTLHEAFVQLASRNPLSALSALTMLKKGRAAFKAAIADHVLPDADTVPVNAAVIEMIRQAKKDGRPVYLATAADRRFASALSERIARFDGIFASENGTNLKGVAKASRLIDAFGPQGFDYIGNDRADLPVWRIARTASLAGATPRATKKCTREFPGLMSVGEREFAVRPYLHALRPHQWLKNVLVALPAIAGHNFNTGALITILIAFISFSLGASGIYLINDMLDLPHDRAHPDKRHRSIAAGLVPIRHAVALLGIVAVGSIGLAFLLPWAYLLTLVAYFGLSLSYSVYLKRKMMIDVVALAALYGIRVVAGSAATDIFLSHWLVAFCFFLFLNLALIKRTTEMMILPLEIDEKIKGRNYLRTDLQTITGLATSAGFVSVLVLALYISSPEVQVLYHHPDLLWGICVILVYWLGRVALLAGRGEMKSDPVMFALTDTISVLAGLLVGAVFLFAL